jgi:lipopolysaccharide transport system ATP-binding protein
MSRSVTADGVAKRYWIPRADAPRLRDYLTRPAWATRAPKRMEIQALRDVSFEVEEGEVFGIIGRNGAGKSTLLKILSRITTPSHGRVTMRGHIASLLEVGTGFHPELTGRENVYLNGMLLGMREEDIDRAFDAIVEFAGVGPYIGVPIKRYSSGMQLRLAFAVAAHLAADVMIIDEVLAVGDAEFQRKCLGAMRDVSRRGRTTLFVSHNMAAVESLCTRVMWLDKGEVKAVGRPDEMVRQYLTAGMSELRSESATQTLADRPRSWVLGNGRLESVTFRRLGDPLGRSPWDVAFGEAFELEVEFELDRPMEGVVPGIAIRSDRGEDVLTSHACDAGSLEMPARSTRGRAVVRIEQPWLRPGTYFLEVGLLSGSKLIDNVRDAAVLVVEDLAVEGSPPLPLKKGVVAPVWGWRYVD